MPSIHFTICARNYLAYALTLRASLLAAAPDAQFVIFLADAPLDEAAESELPAGGNVVAAQDLPLPDLDDMAMRYSLMEFATAIKPYCFQWLFDRGGADAAIYLDPDIFVLGPLDHVNGPLREGAGGVLTPHLDAPLPDDGARPTTAEILASGVYNLGFAALANRPDTRAFVDWWAAACRRDCLSAPERGLFVDQRFADMAPAMIRDMKILRHPGYNAAYWNLTTRPIGRAADGGWTAAGEGLRFFHFSGVKPGDRSVFSKHQTRFRPTTIGPLRRLFEEYLGELDRNGHERWRRAPYAFGAFKDETPIPTPARRVWAEATDRGAPAPAAFAPDYAFYNRRSDCVDATFGVTVTTLMEGLWRMRPDLQAAFPLATAAGRRGFHAWFLTRGVSELGLAEPFQCGAKAGGAGAVLTAARAVDRVLPPPARRALRRRFRSGA